MLPTDLVSFLWGAGAAAFLFIAGACAAAVAGFFRKAAIALKDRLYHPEPEPILVDRRSDQTLPPDEGD